MISEKLVKAFNDQIVAELWSSNLYLQMAFYLKKEGWNGSANWMFKQADEEKEHALKLADYAIKRGGEVKVGMIDVVPVSTLSSARGLPAFGGSRKRDINIIRYYNILIIQIYPF